MINASLQNATSVAMSSDLNTVTSHGIIYELKIIRPSILTKMVEALAYLVVIRSELVKTFLNDMISVQILDENYDRMAERKNNGMDLSIVSDISLNPPPVSVKG